MVISDKVTTVSMAFFTIIYFIWSKSHFKRTFRFSVKKIIVAVVTLVIGHFIINTYSKILMTKVLFGGGSLLGLVIPWKHLYISNLFPKSLIEEVQKRNLESVIYVGWSFIMLILTLIWFRNNHSLPATLKGFIFTGIILILLTLPDISFLNYTLMKNRIPYLFFTLYRALSFFVALDVSSCLFIFC